VLCSGSMLLTTVTSVTSTCAVHQYSVFAYVGLKAVVKTLTSASGLTLLPCAALLVLCWPSLCLDECWRLLFVGRRTRVPDWLLCCSSSCGGRCKRLWRHVHVQFFLFLLLLLLLRALR
jgi:hypothetical protein